MNIKRIFAALLCMTLLFHCGAGLASDAYEGTGFELIETKQADDFGGTIYYFRHRKTGAQVVYLDNGSERRDFSIGFRTPPTDSKGANHVLEHSLLCGSEKYPTKNIMHYVRGSALAQTLNAVTSDDCTYYEIKTPNETEYYNLIDIYMNGIFHPLLLTEENIFKQQGIRLEYVDGKVQYNGVVYNELRIKSLQSTENSVNFLSDSLYDALYGDTAPSFDSGGNLEEIKTLTYEDVLEVYHTYYVPSNSMTYLAGNQDIRKTLQVLDSFFQNFEKKDHNIRFSDTKQQPKEKMTQYNITPDTKTVDIGFMSSGVPMWADMEELYARDIIFNLICEKMEEMNGKNYTSGGNGGGISNLALLVSQVPIEKTEEILSAYENILKQFEESGFDNLDAAIDSYVSQRRNPYLYAPELGIFNGILYHSNPFYFTGLSGAAALLKEEPEIFQTALKTYFTENPYCKIVISGNGKTEDIQEPVSLSQEEIEQIKQDTEAFQAWVDAPDDEEIIAKIPTLTLDEVEKAPAYSAPVHETVENIDFYYTEKQDSENVGLNLFFPIQIDAADLGYLQLMASFLSVQAAGAGMKNVYIDLASMENFHDTRSINPQISIYLSGTGDAVAAQLQQTVDFLQSESVWDEDAFYAYIQETPAEILQNGYRDPYYLSYELKQSTQSAGNAFYAFTRGSIGQGSINYYQFLKAAKPEDYPAMLEKVKKLCTDMILNSVPTVEYVGGSGYEVVKEAICQQFQNAQKKGDGQVKLPMGYVSAATITNLEDANHFMLSGDLADTNAVYSGKMQVLGSVLTANYILPVMRGKYGAYGASVMIDRDGMTCAVAGLADIDLAIQVWRGMGDYLRNLNMTQKELDAVIVSVIKDYDMYYNDSDYGGILTLSEKKPEDIESERDEMRSTTVEDLKGYADLVDELVGQNKVFAVLGKTAADEAEFDFGYYANGDTLDIFPRLTKNPSGYIRGKSETVFGPDDPLTRAEAAALLSELLADKRGAAGSSPYTDVTADDWFHDAVVSLWEKGVLSGYSDGSFRPENTMSRAEFVAMLAKFIYEEGRELENTYVDVDETDWFYPSIEKMAANGFLSGYDGRFYPNDPITRAEAVTILNRMLGKSYEEGMENPFTDTVGHWAWKEIVAAVN